MSYRTHISLTAILGASVTRVWRLLSNRQKVSRLHDLTDAQLRDIGLTRSDVRRASQISFLVDPTRVLNSWARERSLAAQLPDPKPVLQSPLLGDPKFTDMTSCPAPRLAA
ncbi:DUF1127 domain-containing protein [uncultured Roseibium sp.]|uniref:DUF1127 domain-containing protein n=1 Tax=uncultured Roseibium sp. TaxID=1936171 RepID=UPI002592A041|nr:DUF1127 domain-containing protein [uncultured Roseibium sp.]